MKHRPTICSHVQSPISFKTLTSLKDCEWCSPQKRGFPCRSIVTKPNNKIKTYRNRRRLADSKNIFFFMQN